MKGILFKPWKIKFMAEHPNMEVQTRRVIKFKGYSPEIWDKCIPHNGDKAQLFGQPYLKVPYDPNVDNAGKRLFARYEVGETVYIKESYWAVAGFRVDHKDYDDRVQVKYASEGAITWVHKPRNKPMPQYGYHSPMMMPEWAARYFRRITHVRPERLQEITPSDAIKEGVVALYEATGAGYIWCNNAEIRSFIQLWDSLNAKYPFESNPWVWVYTSKLIAQYGYIGQ